MTARMRYLKRLEFLNFFPAGKFQGFVIFRGLYDFILNENEDSNCTVNKHFQSRILFDNLFKSFPAIHIFKKLFDIKLLFRQNGNTLNLK